jgi:hypothetical protein
VLQPARDIFGLRGSSPVFLIPELLGGIINRQHDRVWFRDLDSLCMISISEEFELSPEQV